MSNTHTPTPWSIEGHDEFGFDIDAETEFGIVTLGNIGGRENAAMIVKAVNAHDKLVDALIRCLDRIMAECADPEDLDAVAYARRVLKDLEAA